MDKSRFEQGLKMRRAVLGAEYVDKSFANSNQYDRPLQDLLTEFCWGSVWSRPGLDLRTRSLVNVGMLLALNRPHELRLHLRAALRNGATREEISEVILQAVVYCGAPAAIDAMRIAKEVFGEAA